MHIMKNRKGQSTVEYVLLVTAVIAVIIALVSGGTSGNGVQGKLFNTLDTSTNQWSDMSGRLTTSQSPTAAGGNGESGIHTVTP